MKVIVSRSGGIAGIRITWEVQVDERPDAADWKAFLEELPWDEVDDYSELRHEAEENGIRIGGINPNSFHDDRYVLGSLCHPDPEVRALAERVRTLNPGGPPSSGSGSADVIRRFMHLDALAYLPDDILVKVDRASMAVSLESRAPFLDARVVEFAANLPSSMLVREGRGKWLLRQVLYKYVPKELVDRPKMGFGVPLGEWLSGPLRNWVEDLLDERTLRGQGLLDAAHVRGRLRRAGDLRVLAVVVGREDVLA